MINEMIEGKISAVSASVKNIKTEEGVKYPQAMCKFKLETDSINYEDIAKFDSSIASTLLNIQPMPFKDVDFGDRSILKMGVEFYQIDEETGSIPTIPSAEFKNVRIKDIKVKNKVNVPYYIFTLEMPIESSIQFLVTNIKSITNFKFTKE